MCKPNILIVDDEQSLREVYRLILKEYYDVILAADGISAIDYLTNHPVDVVLTNIKMPGIDGIELLKQIKQNWPQIEVIIITAYASIENAQNATKYGAIDFLTKPATVKEIQEAVNRAIVKKNRAEAKDY